MVKDYQADNKPEYVIDKRREGHSANKGQMKESS